MYKLFSYLSSVFRTHQSHDNSSNRRHSSLSLVITDLLVMGDTEYSVIETSDTTSSGIGIDYWLGIVRNRSILSILAFLGQFKIGKNLLRGNLSAVRKFCRGYYGCERFFLGCHEKMVDGKNFFWVSKLADTKKIWVSKMVDTNINWYRNRYRYRPIPCNVQCTCHKERGPCDMKYFKLIFAPDRVS